MQYKIFFTLFAILIEYGAMKAQGPWVSPKEYQEKLSPFEFDDSVVKQGENIFAEKCIACHGKIGSDSPLAGLVPSPGDPAGEKFQKNSDGSMFYKISEGRGSMTSFKNQLSKEQIWQVIGYIRSYHQDYEQQVALPIEKKEYDGEIKILHAYLHSDKQIMATLQGYKEESVEPLVNVDVKMSAKRYFGNLPLGPVKATNSQGNVYFDVPEHIPGDSTGSIEIITELIDVNLFGNVTGDTLLSIGLPTNKPSLVDKRAMWNNVRKAPYWVLISYGGGVLLAWGIIFYILFQLRSIFYIGAETENKDN